MNTGEPASRRDIDTLGPWFHNLHLPDGAQTSPDHPLGDFPAFKWAELREHIPQDLHGWSVLDIGCNAGYYSFELARRGADVLAIDSEPHYLRQAQWAAPLLDPAGRIRFRQAQLYEIAHWRQRFDLVWFMGVLYHLRYPLLALDIVAARVKRLMVLQTLTMPGEESCEVPPDFGLDQRDRLRRPGWPAMAFIEHRLAGDPTNWWAPNQACVEAMLRSCGLRIDKRPAHEVCICSPDPADELSDAAAWRRAECAAATSRGIEVD